MKLKIVYKSDFISVAGNEEMSYLQASWLQQPTSESFREQLKRVVDMALANHITKALFDVRARAYLEIADQNWLVREIAPLFSGIKLRFAYVVSLSALAAMDIVQIQKSIEMNPQLKEHLNVKIFLLKEEAEEWLLS